VPRRLRHLPSPGGRPLVQIDDQHWLLELFHGPTLAFKDIALQLVGRMFDHVLAGAASGSPSSGATSGDTGSAAIDGVKGCDHVDIVILYPAGRTSEVQRRQMTTVDARTCTRSRSTATSTTARTW
jgi:threonine synthase